MQTQQTQNQAPKPLTNAQLQAQIELLKAENAALAAKKSQAQKITFKVTAPKLDPKTGKMKGSTGAISLYGAGRFPITLYASQWERVKGNMAELEAFMNANADKLSKKGE